MRIMLGMGTKQSLPAEWSHIQDAPMGYPAQLPCGPESLYPVVSEIELDFGPESAIQWVPVSQLRDEEIDARIRAANAAAEADRNRFAVQ